MPPTAKGKKGLARYSRKKPRSRPLRPSAGLSQGPEASVPRISCQPSPVDLKKRKRTTLTSPEPRSRVPSRFGSSPSDVLDQPRELDNDKPGRPRKCPEMSKPAYPTQRSRRRLPVNELAIVSSADHLATRPASPISDSDLSDTDPILDDPLAQIVFPSQFGRHKAPTKQVYPLLSTVRKSLRAPTVPKRKTRPKVNHLPPSILSDELQKGADSFTGSELLVLPDLKRKRVRKPRASIASATLELRKGPHPNVQFDKTHHMQHDFGLHEPQEQQDLCTLEAAGAFDYDSTSSHPADSATVRQDRLISGRAEHVEVVSHPATMTSAHSIKLSTDNHGTIGRPDGMETHKGPSSSQDVEAAPTSVHGSARKTPFSRAAPFSIKNESPSRASMKEALVFAQLSSVSAPARRVTSCTTASASPDEDEDGDEDGGEDGDEDYENKLLLDEEGIQNGSDGREICRTEVEDDDGPDSEAGGRHKDEYTPSRPRPRSCKNDDIAPCDEFAPQKDPATSSKDLSAAFPVSPLCKSWVSETILHSSSRRNRSD